MFLFKTKLTTALGVAFAAALTFGPASPAEAAPPEGMRWIDTVQRTSPRRPSPPARVGPVVGYPRYDGYFPVTVTPAVVPQTPSTATVSVRGPDGVVRTYPVEGPVVQRTAPAFISLRGADGVVRSYPVADVTPAPAAGSGPTVPVVTYPCR